MPALLDTKASIYINGRRADQGGLRDGLELAEYDETLNVTQIQPLFDWTGAQVWEYIRRFDVPCMSKFYYLFRLN